MKLYAKTTSERASKGQGGKWLDIEVKDEQGNVILTLYIAPEGTDEQGNVIRAKLETHESVFLDRIGDIKWPQCMYQHPHAGMPGSCEWHN